MINKHYLEVGIRIVRSLTNRLLLFKKLSNLLGTPCDEIRSLYRELSTKTYLSRVPGCRPTGIFSTLEPLLYILVRIQKPTYVVETGVGAGVSSAMILTALDVNQHGQLFSIDYPGAKYITDLGEIHTDRIPSGYKPGWAIPKHLRTRWTLILGKTSEKLTSLLDRLGKIQVFYHDSEHTYANMMFEYTSVWDFLEKGGVLLSDDTDFSKAFREFCQTKRVKPVYFWPWVAAIKKP